MMTTQTPHAAFDEPGGLAARGTVVVLPGRGERPGLYERFGLRLAADAYRVRVAGDATAELEGVSAQVKALVADAVAPVVLIGSDTGALLAWHLVASGGVPADALVLAGLPDAGHRPVTGEEVELRASCPTHQKLLRTGEHAELGALVPERIPPVLREPLPPITVPVLGLHGDNDFIAPYAKVAGSYANARVSLVDDGRHDVLNSANHRSVAATIVLFLENLRAGTAVIRGAGDVR